MYMDFRDFEAARRIVAELNNVMNKLTEAQSHPRPWRAIKGDLNDFLMHIYHHTLGGRTLACDLDFVEVRDGKIAALIEIKKRGRTMSPNQQLVTGAISKVLNVPVYLLSANWDYTRFWVSKGKKELEFNRREFHEFMQDFEDPSTQLSEVM